MKSMFENRIRLSSGRAPLPAICALALVLAPTLNGCAPQTIQQQQAQACGGFGAGANKTDIGAGVGLAAGALMGYLLAPKGDKAIGAVVGGGVGGVTGGLIGAQLDAQDCQELTAQLNAALQLNRDGTGSEWNSQKSDLHARIVPTGTHTVTQQVAIPRADGVTPPVNLVVASKVAYAASDNNILSAPAADASPLGTVARGDSIRVIGHPAATPSYDLIARSGVAVGYIRAAALTSRPVTEPATTPANIAIVAPVRPAAALQSNAGDNAPVIQLTAAEPCRTVSTTLSSSSGGSAPQTSQSMACQSPDGAWNMQNTGAAL